MATLFKKISVLFLFLVVASCCCRGKKGVDDVRHSCEGGRCNGKPIALVISAPSGCGKDTAINALVEKNKNIVKILNVTTRAMRSNEKDGYDYHFVTHAEFDQMDKQGKFFEKAVVYGEKRAILKSDIEDALKNGKDILFNLDVYGYDQIKDLAGDSFRAIGIYILPPSKEALKKRLNVRGTEKEEVINYRMSLVDDAMKGFEAYEYKIIGEEKEETLSSIESIYKAELIKKNDKKLNDYGASVLKK